MGRYGAALRQVERHMHAVACGDTPERAGSMACEQLETGGKRLRARLALAACEALDIPQDNAICWAAAVELLHNATLVHDDIQDGDTIRRGHPTLWKVHGTAQAINAGDLMLMLPYLALEGIGGAVRGDLCMLLARHAAQIVRGQAAEMALLEDELFDESSYRRAVEGKTGALLGLCVTGAAIMARRSQSFIHELGRAFVELGVLFQLQDDVLDLYGDKGRGEVGCDLYEGKVSALVVAHLQRWPDDTAELSELLRAPRELATAQNIERFIERFQDSGALNSVLQQIRDIEHSTRHSDILHEEAALHAVALELCELATNPIAQLLDSEITPPAEVA